MSPILKNPMKPLTVFNGENEFANSMVLELKKGAKS
jgi:hypothetical protein